MIWQTHQHFWSHCRALNHAVGVARQRDSGGFSMPKVYDKTGGEALFSSVFESFRGCVRSPSSMTRANFFLSLIFCGYHVLTRCRSMSTKSPQPCFSVMAILVVPRRS